MTNLLTIRDNIKEFLTKNDRIATPAFRFIQAFLLFWSLRVIFGYSDKMSNIAVILLLSIVCAFLPSAITVLISGVVGAVNMYSVSLEMLIIYMVFFMLMYFMYLRFFPKCSYIIMFTPLLYILKIHYILPILIGIFVGPIGIVPVIFGVVLFYFSKYTGQLVSLTANSADEKKIQGFTYVINGLLKDKTMLLTIIVFAVVILVTYFIYKKSVDYAWFIAIAVGAVLSIILFLVGGLVLEADINILTIFIGTVVGALLSVGVQFFKGVVDYSRTEIVQFEDDDYYYYVKAAPKIRISEENVSIKRINVRKSK